MLKNSEKGRLTLGQCCVMTMIKSHEFFKTTKTRFNLLFTKDLVCYISITRRFLKKTENNEISKFRMLLI